MQRRFCHLPTVQRVTTRLQVGRVKPAVHPRAMSISNGSRTYLRA